MRNNTLSKFTIIILMILGSGGMGSDLYGIEPNVDSIDYANPQKYLVIPDTLGDRVAILKLAGKLKGTSDQVTIRNVLDWMGRTLKYDGTKAYRWRNFDDVIREKVFGGCADQGIVCGVLLKGAGIPTVWVNTMDIAWIWDFKKGRPYKSWSGHVFLEVYVDGKWSLLDPGGRRIYLHYSPGSRILPGRRFAYHKGNDPKAMIMSLQWEEWKRQTEIYFQRLDESLLPVDEKDTLDLPVATVDRNDKTSQQPLAYVAGDSPYYQIMMQMAREAGLQVAKGFNCRYDQFLPEARGHVLMVETHNGRSIIPEKILEKYYPKALTGLAAPSKRVRIDGTTIVYIEFSAQLQGIGGGESK